MATPNYGFEKRQKELAKKRKKEDKLKAKADRKAGLLPDQADESLSTESPEPLGPATGAETPAS